MKNSKLESRNSWGSVSNPLDRKELDEINKTQGDNKTYINEDLNNTKSPQSSFLVENVMSMIGLERKKTKKDEEEGEKTEINTNQIGIVNQTIQDMIGKKLLKECYKRAEYSINFHFSHFFFSLITHFLYFMVLGPFLDLFLIPIVGLKKVRNMFFIGNTPGFYFQTLSWLLYVTSMIIYIFFPDEEVSTTLIIILTLLSLSRIFVISTRYGYTSPIRMRLMNSPLSLELLQNEYVVPGFTHINPGVVIDEIKAAYWRLNIEEFRICFAHVLNEEWRLKLTDKDYYENHEYNFGKEKTMFNQGMKSMEMEEKMILKKGNIVHPTNISTLNSPPLLQLITGENIDQLGVFYKGIYFARELYLYGKLRAKTYTGPMILLSLTHSLLPFIWNIAYNDTVFGNTTGQIIVLISHTILGILLYSINIFNLAGSEFDLQRKNEMCKALSKIIEWGREDKDWLPSLDILCPVQLNNWYQLRKILMDTGKKYFVRGIAYNSLFLAFLSPLLLLFIMIYFGILNTTLPEYWIVALFDILIFIARIYYVIYLAAKVNDQFSKHKEVLMKTKLHIGNIKTKVHHLYSKIENGEDVAGIVKETQYLGLFFAKFGTERDGEDWLDMIIEQIYHIVEMLEVDEERNPIKLLGFAPTYDFLKGSFWTVLTLIFVIINKELRFI